MGIDIYSDKAYVDLGNRQVEVFVFITAVGIPA